MLRRHVKRAIGRLRKNRYRPLNRIVLHEQRLLRNVALVQMQHPGWEVIPVLKGNAYGHGIEPVAEILNDAPGKYLAVDGYFEAAKIRDITHRRILVMGYILPENIELLDTKRCSFVVQDVAGLRAFGELCRPVRIHIELETGMNRLGLTADELPAYLQELKRWPDLHLEGVMTHMADADNELDDTYTKKQAASFDAMVEQIRAAGFKPKLINIGQTAGSAKVESKYANGVRLGIGAYGLNVLSPKDKKHKALAGLQPVMELKATIIKVSEVPRGAKISYNGTFAAPKKMRVGTLALGYYEGVPRELSNKGVVTHGKTELPILGRVCMNHTMIDLIGTKLKAGDEVTVISHNPKAPNSVTSLSAKYGLFEYATLANLSSSIRRVIVND
jgi:alanine racemase